MPSEYKQFKEKFDELVKSHNGRIVITSHKNPDGDAVSSVLSLYYYLKNYLKVADVKILITGNDPARFSSLSDYDLIEFVDDIANHVSTEDVLIFLDSNNYEQFTNYPDKLKAKHLICIDHHTNNPNIGFDLLFNSSVTNVLYASTAELLFLLFFEESLNVMTERECKVLVLGIYSDTGNFLFADYKRTNSFVVAGKLIKQGKFGVESFMNSFYKSSVDTLKVLSLYLNNMQVGKVANWPGFTYTFVTKEDSKHFSTEDFSNGSGLFKGYINSIAGCNWGFMIKPNALKNSWDISFRSIPGLENSVKVRLIAEHFNGGGHDMAAGGIINNAEDLTAQDVIKKIFEYLENNKPEYIK